MVVNPYTTAHILIGAHRHLNLHCRPHNTILQLTYTHERSFCSKGKLLTSYILLSSNTELSRVMEGSLCHEFQTDLPATDVWEVYGSLVLGQLVPKLLPQVLSEVELVEGDGGVGTVLLVTFPSAG